MKNLVILLIVLTGLSLKSDRRIIWEKSYDFQVYSTWINKIIPCDNGYIFLVNSEDSQIHPGIIARIDNDGNLVWYKKFNDRRFDNLILTKDKSLVISGDAKGLPFLMSFDLNANVKWEKIYTTIDQREYININYDNSFCIKELPDGNFLAAISNGSPELANYVSFILKINTQGQILWDTSFDSKTKTVIHSIEPGYTNDFIVCDSRNDTLRLTKYNVTGKKIWSKMYFAASTFFGAEILKTNDECYIVGGVAEESKDNNLNWDIGLLKVDGNGKVLWYKKYDAGKAEILHQTKLFQDRSIALIASSDYKIYVLNLENNGEIKWNQKVDVFSKNGADIIETSDRCLLIGCMNNFKAWIAKADTIRDIPAYAMKSETISERDLLSGNNEQGKGDNKFSCYPNPFDKNIFITTDLLNCKYWIYDLTGKIRKSGVLNILPTEVNTEDLDRGTYFLKLKSTTEEATFKLIK